MASTTTELSGSKSMPFSNTPNIKIKQSLPKTSQTKLVNSIIIILLEANGKQTSLLTTAKPLIRSNE
jgi:hypothetical protein